MGHQICPRSQLLQLVQKHGKPGSKVLRYALASCVCIEPCAGEQLGALEQPVVAHVNTADLQGNMAQSCRAE